MWVYSYLCLITKSHKRQRHKIFSGDKFNKFNYHCVKLSEIIQWHSLKSSCCRLMCMHCSMILLNIIVVCLSSLSASWTDLCTKMLCPFYSYSLGQKETRECIDDLIFRSFQKHVAMYTIRILIITLPQSITHF